jgi:hypothetical protein
VTVREPLDALSAMPPGVTVNGRNFDGTPTKAGVYPVLIIGSDFLGKPVIAFKGRYTVEDGPTFAKIKDDIRDLPVVVPSVHFDFGAPTPLAVRHSITTPSKVRYFLETAAGDVFPTGVLSKGGNGTVLVEGWVDQPYQTARVRLRAIDSDATVGFSNWFAFGTANPTPDCSLDAPVEIKLSTGVRADVTVPWPFGAVGTVSFVKTAGTLPEGIKLDASTGKLVGTPVKAEPVRAVDIRIDVVNGSNTVSKVCKYNVSSINGSLRVVDATPAQGQHIRIGDSYAGTVSVVGGIPDYELSFSSSQPSLSFSTATKNAPSVGVTGTMNEKGLPHAVSVKLQNGDGNTVVGTLPIYAYGPLAKPVVTDITAKRLAMSTTWGSVVPDYDTVIPDVTTYSKQPVMSVSPALPAGLSFDGLSYEVKGVPSAPVGHYGPFTVSMSDYSGDRVTSAPFGIDIAERDPLIASDPVDPEFSITKIGAVKPVNFSPPSGAPDLAVEDYKLVGPALPAKVGFDAKTGVFTGNAPEFEAIGEYGPYTITATDAEGWSATSSPFSIKISDIAPPNVGAIVPPTKGNVTSPSEPVWVQTPRLDDKVDVTTIASEKSAVRFSFDDQDHPANLFIDPVTGIIGGNATETFGGDVIVRITDGKGRKGTVAVSLTILPFPELSVQPSYDLPRLSQAVETIVTPNSGFWGSPSYKLATPAALPSGLSVDQGTGKIVGSTDVTEQTISGITIKATDVGGSGLTVTSPAFALVIKPRLDMGLSYAGPIKFYFNDSPTKAYTFEHADVAGFPGVLSGSKLDPVTFALTSTTPLRNAPTLGGVGINTATGRFTGNPPTLGKWTATVTATDADGYAATTEATLWATLNGTITQVSGGSAKTLRANETFHTDDVNVTNAVGDVVYSTNPAALPPGLNFSGGTGAFSGHVEGEGTQTILVDATDEDGRSMGMPFRYAFKVMQPLGFRNVEKSSIAATQYDPARAIDVTFPLPIFAMGNIRFGVSGTVPGTLVRKTYDKDGNFQAFRYRATEGATVDTVTTDASTLPLDAIQIDEKLGTLRGVPSKAGTFEIRGTAWDDHGDAYEVPGDATRIAYNSASTDPITLIVGAAKPLELVASANPKGIVVPDGNGNVTITPTNLPYGIGIAAKDWSFAGMSGLPQGVTYEVKNGSVIFSGTSTVFGTYSNIVVTAKDVLGRADSENMTFKVFLSTDPIILNVADIVTKVGQPIKMEAPRAAIPLSTSNTFGTLVFKSPDIAAHPGVTFDKATGAIGGTLSSTQSFVINLSVTDDTSRITSKAVNVTVIPNLRLIVASIVPVAQGEVLDTATATDYALGKVKYSKGNASAWPEGVTLDENTGKISGEVNAQVGKYPNLIVIGTDETGDTQPSNPFTIDVTPIEAAPIISDIPNDRLVYGTVGAVAQPFVPVVKDSVKSKPWNYSGTVYSINKSLPAGLSFDTATGVISGQPTVAAILKNVVITVVSQSGDSDSTAPFWFGVAPAGQITPTAGQVTTYYQRTDKTSKSNPLLFDNTVGTLTFSPQPGVSSGFDASTGVYTQPPVADAASVINGQPADGWVNVTTVKDEFGRTGSFTSRVINMYPVSITATAPTLRVNTGIAVSARQVATVSGIYGSAAYSATGLPSGLSIDPQTGTISGKVTDKSLVGSHAVTVTVTDQYPNAPEAASVTITIEVAEGSVGHRYWRAVWNPTYSYYVNFGGIDLLAADGSNLSTLALDGPATASITTRFVALDIRGCIDGNVGSECYPVVDDKGEISIYFDFKTPVAVESAKWTARTDGFAGTAYNMRIESSDDNSSWLTEMRGTSLTSKIAETITR